MNRKPVETQHLVAMYTNQHLTLRQIGATVGMSAPGVRKRLLKAGVSKLDGTWVASVCELCGKDFKKLRSKWRLTKGSYCTNECYYASRENPGYKPWRQGQRIARAIVSQYIKLEPEWVVDHRDGDNRNNNRDNLRVYASQSDHLKMHHGGNVAPVWDGRTAGRGPAWPGFPTALGAPRRTGNRCGFHLSQH